MDPQAPNIPISQPSNSTVMQSSNSSNNITIISMALFVLLSLGIIIFLYYQNQQLKGMIAKYQTPAASPTPVATVDPTLNWMTYPPSTVIGLPFSFKYPTNVTESQAQDLVYLKSGGSTLFFRFVVKTKDIVNLIANYQPFATPKISFATKTPVNFGDLSGYKATSTDTPPNTYYFLGNNSLNGVFVFSYPASDSTAEALLNQIVPTIKIISPSNSPTPSNIPVSTSSALPVTY